MVTNVQFAVLENEVKNMKRELTTLRTSNAEMFGEIHKIKIAVDRATWISVTMYTIGMGVVAWLFRGVLGG